jgi:ribosomal protein L29
LRIANVINHPLVAPSLQRDIKRTLARIESTLHPTLRGQVETVQFSNFDKIPEYRRALAYAEFGEIHIRSERIDTMLADLARAQAIPAPSIQYAVAHEVGHLVLRQLEEGLDQRGINRQYRAMIELAPLTSNAVLSYREGFADAFATATTGIGNRKHPFVRYVKKVIVQRHT